MAEGRMENFIQEIFHTPQYSYYCDRLRLEQENGYYTESQINTKI